MSATRSAAPDARVVSMMNDAFALATRGRWSEAIQLWERVLERMPAFLPAELALAQARLQTGDAAAAIAPLEGIVARAPSAAPAWLALAVARSMLGRHDEAVAAAERAVSHAPALAAAHLGLGDVARQAGRLDFAAKAYRQAVALAPDDPDALNKLAAIERTQGRLDEAEALLRKALGRAGAHPYARVNLGTLLLQAGRLDEGQAILAAASRDRGLPPDARSEIDEAESALRERAALRSSIHDAVERDDPAPIVAALLGAPRSAKADPLTIRDMRALAERFAACTAADAPFARGAPASRAWPAIEAHHNLLASRDDAAIARSIELVAHPDRAASDLDRDIVRYARAVADSARAPPPAHDAVALEAWLRWRHAQLVGHRPSLDPGQLKLVNNLIGTVPRIPRTPASRFPPSLRVVMDDLAPGIGIVEIRTAFLYLATVDMHAFTDANGRAARLALNGWLRRLGVFPHLRPAGSDDAFITAARESGEVRPFLAYLAEGTRYAAALDRDWAAREAS